MDTVARTDGHDPQERGLVTLNQSTFQAMSILLTREIVNVQRSDLKPFCFQIDTMEKSMWISCETDSDVYAWIDDIYSVKLKLIQKTPKSVGSSSPSNIVHNVHVGYNAATGAFEGLPPAWKALLNKSQITKEDMASNPQAIIEVLGFFADNLFDQKDNAREEMEQLHIEKPAVDDKQVSMCLNRKKSLSHLRLPRRPTN